MTITRLELPTKFLSRPKRQAAQPSPQAKGTHIGRLYTGQHKLHVDTQSGVYFEALPPVQGEMLRVQRALLAPVAAQPKSRGFSLKAWGVFA